MLSAKHKATKFNNLNEVAYAVLEVDEGLTESFGDVTLSIDQIPEGE